MNNLSDIPKVSVLSANAYAAVRNQLVEYVDREMLKRNDLTLLIGNNPLSMIQDNHKNHADFMTAYFNLNQPSMLYKTVAWVLRSYQSHGFSLNYFKIALPIWQEAVKHLLPADQAAEITTVYDWMLSSLDIINLEKDLSEVKSENSENGQSPDFWQDAQQLMLNLMLTGDSNSALAYVENMQNNDISLRSVYTNLIMPTLYSIGDLWENGQISIAHEHLATSVVIRVMASLYHHLFSDNNYRGKVIVTIVEKEAHEIGARMIADILELSGWDVQYFGSGTKTEAILEKLRQERPHIMAISVTMSYNLAQAQSLIHEVRSDASLADLKIVVGGYAFHYLDSSHRKDLAGVDLQSTSLAETIDTVNSWWDNGSLSARQIQE